MKISISNILIQVGFGVLIILVLYCVGNLLYLIYGNSLSSFIIALSFIVAVILIILGMLLDREKVKK